MAADPYRYFRIEAREILDDLSRGLVALERGPVPPELVSRLLRGAHTLKGAARVVRLPAIAECCHLIEDGLTPLRDHGASIGQAEVDALLARVDEMEGHLAALGARPAIAAVPAAAPAPAPSDPAPVARADAAEAEALLESLTEVGVEVDGLRVSMDRLQRGADVAALLTRQLDALPRAEAARALAEAHRRDLEALRAAVGAGVDRLERELREARHAAESVRLVPVSELFAVLDRAARDAARELGKAVEVVFGAGEVRVDAPVLARIQPALVQLVRNAVAHGIESARERRDAGKPPGGRIILQVERAGGRAVFRCSDDGGGVDLEAVRRLAVHKGLLPADGAAPGPDALMALLLRGGLSTVGDVTQVSGRGVGMDVVRDAAARLGGEVRIQSEPGRGTAVSITVPISMASIPALLVEAAGAVTAIPLEAVRGTTRIRSEDLAATADGALLTVGGRLLPFGPLADWLSPRQAGKGAAPRTAVVLSAGSVEAAVGVDRLLGAVSVVLRPLPPLAPADRVVAGSWFDEAGMPRLVVEPAALVAALQEGGGRRAAPEVARRLPVLVVDDSLTTRMLEQSILESAGYEAEVAVSAEEGLEKARAKRFGLFLVDVEMPGMDGFAFVERLRADAALRRIPAILVTSRNAPEDRARGVAVGADAYVVKSEFDQNRLLGMIRGLMGEA